VQAAPCKSVFSATRDIPLELRQPKVHVTKRICSRCVLTWASSFIALCVLAICMAARETRKITIHIHLNVRIYLVCIMQRKERQQEVTVQAVYSGVTGSQRREKKRIVKSTLPVWCWGYSFESLILYSESYTVLLFCIHSLHLYTALYVCLFARSLFSLSHSLLSVYTMCRYC